MERDETEGQDRHRHGRRAGVRRRHRGQVHCRRRARSGRRHPRRQGGGEGEGSRERRLALRGGCREGRKRRSDDEGGDGRFRPYRHSGEQRRDHPSADADGGCDRGGVRPRPRGQRQIGLSLRAPYRPAHEGTHDRRDRQYRLHRRDFAAPESQLVQRLQGLDDHRDQDHGRGARALRRACQRALPGGGGDAAAEKLPWRGHAGDAGEIPRDDPAGPVLAAVRPRQLRRVPLLGGGRDGHRGRDGGGRGRCI